MTMPPLDAIRALDGRNFATLTPEELAVLRFYRDQGRKFDVDITITSDVDTKALEFASREQADELMRRANSHVHVVVGDGAADAWAARAGVGMDEAPPVLNAAGVAHYTALRERFCKRPN